MVKKLMTLLLLTLLVVPLAYAEEEKCGLTNLAVCIPQKFYEFTLNVVNAPLQPFLDLTKNLLSEPVNIENFIPLWAVIIYIISIFYGLFIIIAGFNLIVSGYSSERRERAKQWLKNVVLMVFFVQASYYIYSIILEMASSMTAGVINLIEPDFFLLSVDNTVNLGLQMVLAILYLLNLLLSITLLSLRYLLVAVGVMFFPIGLFLNFIPPLKNYGKLIINILLIIIFLPFIQSLMLLAASKLVEIPIFENFKILVMSASFNMINMSMILLVIFAVVKAAFAALNSDVGRATKIVYKGL
ncbi:hypothetical protein ISS05_03900 [Candidatus Woesearchaeota archaeon]|nr:hypothetical protein [Candidatus Woesearchaeota archaeon]